MAADPAAAIEVPKDAVYYACLGCIEIAAGQADPHRLFYGGWSWGGYLTVWTIGHTSRYRAAVAGAAVVDTVYQYVTSDINHGVAAEWEYRGNPWKQLDRFDRSNPMRSLGKVVTPTLVLHGEADGRVPFDNGRMLYRALSDVGCEVELRAYDLYKNLADEAPNEAARQALAELAEQEKRHAGSVLKKIEQMNQRA